MTKEMVIDWLYNNLDITEEIAIRFMRDACTYGRTIVCGICEDYPYGIVLAYHNNSDEYEII